MVETRTRSVSRSRERTRKPVITQDNLKIRLRKSQILRAVPVEIVDNEPPKKMKKKEEKSPSRSLRKSRLEFEDEEPEVLKKTPTRSAPKAQIESKTKETERRTPARSVQCVQEPEKRTPTRSSQRVSRESKVKSAERKTPTRSAPRSRHQLEIEEPEKGTPTRLDSRTRAPSKARESERRTPTRSAARTTNTSKGREPERRTPTRSASRTRATSKAREPERRTPTRSVQNSRHLLEIEDTEANSHTRSSQRTRPELKNDEADKTRSVRKAQKRSSDVRSDCKTPTRSQCRVQENSKSSSKKALLSNKKANNGIKESKDRTPIAKLRVRKSLIARTKPVPVKFESDGDEDEDESSDSDSQSDQDDSEEEFSEELGEIDSDRVPLKLDHTVKPLKNRENEFQSLKDWISSSLMTKIPLSVYISGPPGTGKTATTTLALKIFQYCSISAHVNCVTTKNQKDLIKSILLACDSDEDNSVAGLSSCLKSLNKPLILILDEVDHLSTTSNSVLYSAFKWPFEISSNLIIIGIANSIDLTERVLPKLKLVQTPKRLLFTPYSQENIASILQDKMKNDENKLDSKAIELCARKVAAMSGDLRTALLVFKQSKNKMAINAMSGTGAPSSGVREVLGVLGNVYSSPISKAKLPLQSELLLAVCLTMSTNNKTPLTVNGLFKSYSKACELTNIPELDSDDLNTAFQTLESQSFITVAKNGQIRLQVDAKTARGAISSNGMIEQVKHIRV